MAIFGDKKEKKETKTVETAEVKVAKTPFKVAKRKMRRQTTKSNHTNDLSRVLLRPRITEKASNATANKTYVFEIATTATKKDVEHAIEHYYKVKPEKVNMVKIPAKKKRHRNKRTFGMSPVGKKAYVYLKDGDSIEFV